MVKQRIYFFAISYTVVREKRPEKEKKSYNNILLCEMFKLFSVSCIAHLDPRLNVTLRTWKRNVLHVGLNVHQYLWMGRIRLSASSMPTGKYPVKSDQVNMEANLRYSPIQSFGQQYGAPTHKTSPVKQYSLNNSEIK
ncbi:hypothetical protein TNCV_5129311 [Trichonephila clavipes]|nr:hypothetical protein TNCV_5129311 [Trichonephila clavipes]